MVTRSVLQLVGIAAMVIASRMLESDVMTIRESVWFTKNTYKYEDVVRMIPSVCMVPLEPNTSNFCLDPAQKAGFFHL